MSLEVPDFYVAARSRQWNYRPDAEALLGLASGLKRELGLRPAAEDTRTTRLLLIDEQRDFCFPEGTLYVAGRSGTGAMDDSDRLVRFVYRNLDQITQITCTLDTHYPFQVFSPAFWLDAEGRHPTPHQTITTRAIRAGEFRADAAIAPWVSGSGPGWLDRYVEHYCSELERAGRYELYLWPPHCLVGSDGHALVGIVHEARLFHAYARSAPNRVVIKGEHPLSEHYSALAPEVLVTHEGEPLARRDQALLDELLGQDRLVIAGQAASHCVRFTLHDLLEEIRRRDASLARRVYVLRDCMSAVAVPDPERPGEFLADFSAEVERALAEFAAAGVHLVESTTPMSEWPGA